MVDGGGDEPIEGGEERKKKFAWLGEKEMKWKNEIKWGGSGNK